MPDGWITWANLRITAEERRALRRAGIAPHDLETLSALDLVAATEELVTEERAARLKGRASLLRIATPAWVRSLERAGIRDRQDLAGRDPLDLFDTWQQVAAYTRPDVYQYLVSTIEAAGGPAHPVPDDITLIRRAWVRRFGEGDGTDPAKTRLRLRIESLRVNAPVVHLADGRPPLRHTEVATDDPVAPTTFVGHWQWAGRFAPFLRLESLAPGSIVEVGSGRTMVTYEAVAVLRGAAPLGTDELPDGSIRLITPPHLRWAPWLRDWDLPASDEAELERTWVQVAVVAAPRL